MQSCDDFTEEQQGQILVALTNAFIGLGKRQAEMSEAEVEGIIYTRVRTTLPGIFGAASQSLHSKRYRSKKRHLKERLGQIKWRTFMALYRAVRDEQEDTEDSAEVILARMEATIKRSGAIISEMETLNKQAGDVGGKITTLQEEIDDE